MGIPEAEIGRIFVEFYRASNARGSQIPGSGVGLAGVKELVERFDGQLELVSEENRGSAFTVRLPLFEGEN
jgi:two-component system phosphate regulon sensor histidine kinase PhoR